ncbi:MAG: divergent polysaccharide deacetylase family protein [Alphaproteobacteria bacterium]|nr:divergent polysaccharide deacetylase family protein [Alphaproteobacteria bacterium]
MQVEPEKTQQPKEPTEEILPNDTPQTQDFSEQNNYAEIVIIIDDMGVNRDKTQKISSLQYPITASFLTYAPHLKEQIEQSQNSGQEIMVHVPMEPNVMQNYTEQMLTTDMTDEEIVRLLNTMLQQVPQAVGINNHMGSKFTEDEHRMGVVMQVLAEKKLIFVDSKTTAQTTGYKQSQLFGIKSFTRDIFLDNKNDYDYILSQLQKAEKIAHETVLAIAIGHPKEQTYQALKDWLPTLQDKGLKLTPISKINNYNEGE